jgi:erythromycin esterase-like protein
MSIFSTRSSYKESEAISLIREKAINLNSKADLTTLFDKIGNSRIVMLGEASHGTHEYYTWRSYITKKLITEKNFNFIAVEGDWPDCYNINCYIKGSMPAAKHITDVLKNFDRWPTWMWGNWEVAELCEWLQQHNKESDNKAGFYGLDVYSLWESLEAIRNYLEKADPDALQKAMETYRCFEPYKEDGTSYAYAYAKRLVPELCEDAVMQLLQEMQKRSRGHESSEESMFSAEQNALITVNAEKYYRAMVSSSSDSWNIRDSHMQETLERLLDFHGPQSKAIVWAHNTHIGDASATDMADDGMYNIGELARRKFSDETFLIGFGSYAGSVIAGNSWGAKMEVMDVPNGRKGSWEHLLNKAGAEDKLLLMDDFKQTLFGENSLDHRAIGVVYRPQYEHYGNYVATVLPKRYDAFIFLNNTKALHPLHVTGSKISVPDTYPFGM